jgi:predicted trehalose synthase
VLAGAAGAVRSFASRSPPQATDGEKGRLSDSRNVAQGELPRRLVLKLFRRTAPGQNPEVEVGANLTDVSPFARRSATSPG